MFRDIWPDVHMVFVSAARTNDYTEELKTFGVETQRTKLNDPQFDALVAERKPAIVVFDCFPVEEQFSWRVRGAHPTALHVLDTQDLHALRRVRQAAVAAGASTQDVVAAVPLLSDDYFLRELSAIRRADLSLLVSPHERQLLIQRFGVPEHRLADASLFYNLTERPVVPAFAARRNFVTIGHFRHPPNADALVQLKRLWPRIRERLPDAQLHVYGAHATRADVDLNSPADGFVVKGHTKDQYKTLAKYRVTLSPLRFGAGVKGKFADSFYVGTPAVTSSIGAEGMALASDTDGYAPVWGGAICDDDDAFVEAAVRLYSDEHEWSRAQAQGYSVLAARYDYAQNTRTLERALKDVLENGIARRSADVVQSLLWLQQNRSTEFFSRYVELKRRHEAQLNGGDRSTESPAS